MTDTDSEILAMVYDGVRALAAVRHGLHDDVAAERAKASGRDLADVLRLTGWHVDTYGRASAHIVNGHAGATDPDPASES